jgi:hypothetical protein
MFLAVDAPDRQQAENVLDTVCRVARGIARSDGKDLEFGDRVYPGKPNSFPYSVEPRVWHFTRGEYTEGDQRSTWRIPSGPQRQETDPGDPLGPPEPDSMSSTPLEVDLTALLQAPLRLAPHVNGEQQQRYLHLLFWLSAAGHGSWDTFVRVSGQLGASKDNDAARRLMRRLILLGHLESNPNGSAWSAAPAALVQLAADPTRAFWCGQRGEPTRRRLGEVWPIATSEPQPGDDGPPRWLVTVGKVRDPAVILKARALPISWEGAAAERWISQMPNLDGWRASLFRVQRLTAPESAQRWHAGAYRGEPAFRVVEGRPQGPAGLYRLSYGEDGSSFQLTGFLDAHRGELLRGDWYGLRFLAARQLGQSCPARWLLHNGRSVLLLPRSCRWPLLYERALVLTSGLLPIQDGDRLCYLDVPRDIASTLAKLLGATLL